ncbi:hypothetical protein RASY3_09830 [Ruminococcus albus SY3]|uniref:Fibronectin type-III domain-containing protein n=1 Tax=Ruminococcus albus SY3 TaxID=1341156 RepID=A0A011V499_RUMAL|nr:hypothetical protein [Ruminococcus albus]EXM40307.1 hypothetical protein RASY3_09830 [Ruminococcus albus SY3]
MEKKYNVIKRTLAGMTAVMCMAGCLPALAANAEDKGESYGYHEASEQVTGGWEVVRGDTSPESNPDAVAAMDNALKYLDGVAYTPVAVLARQCVAGTNYCMLCKVKPITPNATPSYHLVYVYEDLKGNAEIIGRTTVLNSPSEGATGGYSVNDGDTSLSAHEDVLAAFNKAMDGRGGVDVRPIAYLGSQLVAGMNHMLLCKSTVVYPGAKPSYSIMTVYEDLDGNCQLSTSLKIDFGNISEFNRTIHCIANEPTCTKDGNIEYWYNTSSYKYYSDKKFVNEISYEDTIVKALGHDMDSPEWTWSDDHTSAHLTVKCNRCGEKAIDEDAVVTKKQIYPATYNRTGFISYVATVTINDESWENNCIVVLPKLTYTAPTISYEKGEGAVKLCWTEVEGVEEYGVAGFIGGKWQLLDHGKSTSYVLKNLKAGTSYKVAVVAKADGQWIKDFSNAVTVDPKEAYCYPNFRTRVINGKIGYKWEAVPGAEKYAVAVCLANKWQIVKQLDSNVLSWTSPKVQSGTYKTVVVAKINGKWVTVQAPANSVTVSVN